MNNNLIKNTVLLKFIKYNRSIIHYNNINTFRQTSKHYNDKNNKIREHIIGAIINNKIPSEFFTTTNEWTTLKKSLFNVIHLLNSKFDKIECIHKEGECTIMIL